MKLNFDKIMNYDNLQLITGIKLLMKMGWRQGRSIKDTHADSLYGIPSQLTLCLFAFRCVVFLSFVF